MRQAAAFALGEIEAVPGAAPLSSTARGQIQLVRARAIEALGKIAAALPAKKEARRTELGAVILAALDAEGRRRARTATSSFSA